MPEFVFLLKVAGISTKKNLGHPETHSEKFAFSKNCGTASRSVFAFSVVISKDNL